VLRINVLGGLYVTRDGHPASGAAGQPRRLALLALLAIAGDRGMTRDALLAYLWPEADEERGRRALTQALYALRRDLGDDEAVTGLKDLRLNPELVASDVGEFRAALAAGDDARAAELWRGPFLEGFHLPGSDAFERWVEEQRTALQHDSTALLDRLARRAQDTGDPRTAVLWLRKLAGTDPLNGRIAARLMRALALQGDLAGALQHARVYETLLRQELDLPPDREVVELADELRRGAATAPRTGAAATGEAPASRGVRPSEPAPAPPSPPWSGAESPNRRVEAPPPSIHETSGWATVLPPPAPPPREPEGQARLAVRVVSAFVVLLFVAAVYFGWRAFRNADVRAEGSAPPARVVAVGRITHYASGGPGALGEPLADMLATNLARIQGLRMVSNARMVEIAEQLASARDTSPKAMAAARQAGATELLDGALYDLAPGQFRLDLRRVDLATGDVQKAYTITGPDLFTLADSGTAALLRDLGMRKAPGSLAEVSTSSVEAYQAYEAGLRLYFAGDLAAAEQRFAEALARDSGFAMAAYYSALAASAGPQAEAGRRMELAVRLADRASDRERLIIKSYWAFLNSSPRLAAFAETLSVRYPDELDGHYYRGQGANLAGDYAAAIAPFREVIRRDSLGLSGRAARCLACQAYPALGFAYGAMDSLTRTIQVMQEWVGRQPTRALPWRYLAGTHALLGHIPEAERAAARADSLEPGSPAVQGMRTDILLLTGRYRDAETRLRAEVESGSSERRREALWELAVALRQQGRFEEALGLLQRYRRMRREWANPGAVSNIALQEGQVLFELGRHRAAVALFDSAAAYRPTAGTDTSAVARSRVWAWTHLATVLAASGDTARLQRLADSMQVLGRVSGFGRDRRLHAYVRGLLAAARRDDGLAATYFRESIQSPTYGYTRANYELAGAYLRLNRPEDAVATLQAAHRAGLTGSNLYITRTELSERLAQAFEAAGWRDSAGAYWARVARAWEGAEPPLVPRRDSAKARAKALGALP
jgi:DNA-binding SARP family transcriptional activator/TolA-binding protein